MNPAIDATASSLVGMRVLDLSRVLAGPWCTQVLGDLGADVVKVERPGVGDDTRGWGPPLLRDAVGADSAESAYFLGANRNKRSITIDLAHGEGQALVRVLAQHADVLVENFKVGDMARYGLDHASLAVLNPQLVYCSITGYGQTGPYRERAGYDYAVLGLGGLMSVTGERDDLPGGGHQKVGVAVGDLFTGLYATVGILAELRHRDVHGFRRGLGQYLDMSLIDTQVAMLANLGASYLVSGDVPGRAGNAHQTIRAVSGVRGGRRASDFGRRQRRAVRALLRRGRCGVHGCRAAFCPQCGPGVPSLEPGSSTLDGDARAQPRRLAGHARSRPGARRADQLPGASLRPQVKAREMIETLSHPLDDALRLVASPLKLSATPTRTRHPSPLLGQHCREVLVD